MKALAVGGFDPGGRVGVFADREAFSRHGLHTVSVISAIFLGSANFAAVSGAALREQLETYFDPQDIAAIKIGFLANREIIETLAGFLEDKKDRRQQVVFDACLENRAEEPWLSGSAVSLVKMRILPLAGLCVIYLSEAGRLAGIDVRTIDQMKEAAEAIHIYGPDSVLVRADRLVDGDLVDILYDGREHAFFFTKSAPQSNLRDRRDSFAAAIAAGFAEGLGFKEAIERAKNLIDNP